MPIIIYNRREKTAVFGALGPISGATFVTWSIYAMRLISRTAKWVLLAKWVDVDGKTVRGRWRAV